MSITTEIEQPALDVYLRSPAHYPDPTQHVQVIETHCSWVYLTERYAYKLKKPVAFGFLDFSTPQRRRAACEAEVRLNRRLAPDVYLDVVGMTPNHHGGWVRCPVGEAAECLVKMRRLPREACLEERLARGELSERELEGLADFLANFYQKQPPLMLRPERALMHLRAEILANERDLLANGIQQEALIKQIHRVQLDFLERRAATFNNRVCDGRFIEGHGDLRPDHIYLLHRPTIIDCLEFSAELRTLDIADELAFLAMECDRLQHAAVGERILARYTTVTGDAIPPAMITFYKIYRACVRAKVESLCSLQQVGTAREAAASRSRRYLELAANYVNQLQPQRMIVMTGLMGSGKSTLAAALANRFMAVHLQTDEIRREMFGDRPSPDAYRAGRYDPQRLAEVYDQLYQRTAAALTQGHSVVVDGAFLDLAQRHRFFALSQEASVDFLSVRCHCPRDVALQWLAARSRRDGPSRSDGRAELYDQQARDYQIGDGGLPTLVVDTQRPLGEQVTLVEHRLGVTALT